MHCYEVTLNVWSEILPENSMKNGNEKQKRGRWNTFWMIYEKTRDLESYSAVVIMTKKQKVLF